MTSENLAPSERHDLGSHGRELILDARNVGVDFKVEGGVVNAVRDVSFQLHKGETIALVGESGSGKSTLALAAAGMLPRSARATAGDSRFWGVSTIRETPRTIREIRRKHLGFVFQTPISSLDPSMRIGRQLELAANGRSRKSVLELLNDVRLSDAEYDAAIAALS